MDLRFCVGRHSQPSWATCGLQAAGGTPLVVETRVRANGSAHPVTDRVEGGLETCPLPAFRRVVRLASSLCELGPEGRETGGNHQKWAVRVTREIMYSWEGSSDPLQGLMADDNVRHLRWQPSGSHHPSPTSISHRGAGAQPDAWLLGPPRSRHRDEAWSACALGLVFSRPHPTPTHCPVPWAQGRAWHVSESGPEHAPCGPAPPEQLCNLKSCRFPRQDLVPTVPSAPSPQGPAPQSPVGGPGSQSLGPFL